MLHFLPPRETSILSVDALKSEEKYNQEEVDRSNGDITGIVSFSSHSGITIFYIQKHHLQLTSAVNTPPRMGPKQMAIPNELETMPRKRGLRSRATDNVTILKAP